MVNEMENTSPAGDENKTTKSGPSAVNMKTAVIIPGKHAAHYDESLKLDGRGGRRSDCAFFEQLDAGMQSIFSNFVPHVVKGVNPNEDTINPEIQLSSQTSLSDRRYVILHAGELENNIVNKNSQAQGKTLYES